MDEVKSSFRLTLRMHIACGIRHHIVIFDAFKRRPAALAIVLRRQQLLSEKRKQFGVERSAVGTVNSTSIPNDHDDKRPDSRRIGSVWDANA